MIASWLDSLKDQGLHRLRQVSDDAGFRYHFASNDYLGLAFDPRLKAAFSQGFARYPTGSSASIAISGYFSIHKELESSFAEFLDAEDALVFSSGFAANLAIVALLEKLHYQLIIDKAIHASFYEGIALAKASYLRFMHQDYDDLEKKIAQGREKKIVALEGIYSMSGQVPDLSRVLRLCQERDALVFLDESHSFGVLGPKGAGLAATEAFDKRQVPLRLISFGKALAAQGAIVVGQRDWIDALFQVARTAIYSTNMSPALAYGVLQSLDLLRAGDTERKRLFEIIAYFRKQVAASSLQWRPSETPIQQLQLGSAHKALYYAGQLEKAGILCKALRQPTVNLKETGLRVVLNAHHEQKAIDLLFQTLEQIKGSYCAD